MIDRIKVQQAIQDLRVEASRSILGRALRTTHADLLTELLSEVDRLTTELVSRPVPDPSVSAVAAETWRKRALVVLQAHSYTSEERNKALAEVERLTKELDELGESVEFEESDWTREIVKTSIALRTSEATEPARWTAVDAALLRWRSAVDDYRSFIADKGKGSVG